MIILLNFEQNKMYDVAVAIRETPLALHGMKKWKENNKITSEKKKKQRSYK